MKPNNRKDFSISLARQIRKQGYDNHKDYKEILREIRKELKMPKQRMPRRIKDILTRREIRDFLNTAYSMQGNKNSIIKGLQAETFIKSGCRNSELCNLRVENIDFETGQVLIKEGKGSKDRLVVIPPSLCHKIQIYLGGRKTGYLFINQRGNPFQARGIQRTIKDVKEKAGIVKDITPHSLRHSFATMLLQGGVDIREIQEILGHNNISTTEIYTQYSLEHIKDKIIDITDKLEQVEEKVIDIQ